VSKPADGSASKAPGPSPSNRRSQTPDSTPILSIDNVEEGTADTQASEGVAYCKACDAELEVGNLFCVECGERI
jgi:hypothetical protein